MDKAIAKTCGCKMEPVNDEYEECDLCSEATGLNDGTGWVIEYCPLHAAAPALLEALESMLNVEGPAMLGGRSTVYYDMDVRYHFDKARAAIAQVRGETHG